VINVALLGSTGSIGCSTLDVLRQHPQQFRVVALAARRNVALLAQQIREWQPQVVALADAAALPELQQQLTGIPAAPEIRVGPQAFCELAEMSAVDYVVAAVVGAAGLPSTLAAARAGKRILLANKESLVMAGPLLLAAVRAAGATLLPLDSEHSAIFQCLPPDTRAGETPHGLRRVVLTASGGPFLDWPIAQLSSVTPAQACAHPNWVMGQKISVDSATLMNKGLELIEACLLFGLAAEQVEVIVHRQSIVHSLVEYLDGSMLAQLGVPDMRTPIAYALAWPQRLPSGVDFLDLIRTARLDFCAPDNQRFPCLALAQAAARAGGLAPAILNAANEVTVQAFLEGRLNFTEIASVIEAVLTRMSGAGKLSSLEEVMAADAEARQRAVEIVP
jgi:1-deoxy-D-xylulose-5-phosphate reductoisomerase